MQAGRRSDKGCGGNGTRPMITLTGSALACVDQILLRVPDDRCATAGLLVLREAARLPHAVRRGRWHSVDRGTGRRLRGRGVHGLRELHATRERSATNPSVVIVRCLRRGGCCNLEALFSLL